MPEVLLYVYCHYITIYPKGELLWKNDGFFLSIEPGLYVTPRNYEWYSLITMKKNINYYNFISIGQRWYVRFFRWRK
jgi:hypothetical protein